MVIPNRRTAGEPKKPAAAGKKPEEKTLTKTVKEILDTVGAKMKDGDVKASVGDYIRLLQLQKELAEEPKPAMRVTWIEEPESSEE